MEKDREPIRPGQGVSATGETESKAAMSSSNVAFADGGDNNEAARACRRSTLQRWSSVALRLNLKRELEGLKRSLTLAASWGSEPDDGLESLLNGEADEAQPQALLWQASSTATTDELISSLKETICRNEETMSQLRRRLAEMESQKKSAEGELSDMKKAHAKMKKANFDLIQNMAAKASEQLRSRDKKQMEADKLMAKYLALEDLYGALAEKVEQMADENGSLVAKIQKLEKEGRKDREELAAMAGVREERDALHRSLEEAVEMATGMGDTLDRMARDRQSRVNEYEKRLAELNAKLAQATLKQTQTDEENDLLRMQFADAEKENDLLRTHLADVEKENDVLSMQLADKGNLAKAVRGEKKEGKGTKISAYINRLRGEPGRNEGGNSSRSAPRRTRTG